jgi:hypothetical protein
MAPIGTPPPRAFALVNTSGSMPDDGGDVVVVVVVVEVVVVVGRLAVVE